MNSESLSQNEIDLLFSKGGAEAAPRKAEGATELQVYDFRRPARISKDRKRSLHAMYGLLAKSIESWITGRVRDHIDLELQSVEQLTFGEFVLALPSPCASYIVEGPDGVGQGVIDFGHEFAYYVVDRFMGGVGQHPVMPRALTTIERGVVRILADRVGHLLSDVWKDYVRLDLRVTGFEPMPEMLQAANREDPVLVANLNVTMGDVTSLLLLCLPFATLEKFFTGTTSRRPVQVQGSEEERARDRKELELTIRDSRISVGARFPSFEVPLTELADLKPGAVLPTGLGLDSEIDVLIEGQERFKGLHGRLGRKLAVRVVEPVKSVELRRAKAG